MKFSFYPRWPHIGHHGINSDFSHERVHIVDLSCGLPFCLYFKAFAWLRRPVAGGKPFNHLILTLVDRSMSGVSVTGAMRTDRESTYFEPLYLGRFLRWNKLSSMEASPWMPGHLLPYVTFLNDL